jgi:heme A synthase
VFVLVLTGAYTRASGASGACLGFPGCAAPGQALQALGGESLVHIHLLHRGVAYVASVLALVSAAITWRSRRGYPSFGAAAWLLAGSVVAQVAIGAGAVSLGLPAFLRGAHVAGAAAVWASSVFLYALEVRLTRPGGEARPAALDGAAARARTKAALA